MSLTQRWKDRRDSYRQRGERFHPDEYGVDLMERDAVAKAFVIQHHYSMSYPAARCRVGLYRKRPGWFTSELVGVAVFSVPVQPASLPHYTGCTPSEGIELGRFVLLDEVPFNAESWFLARARKALRATLPSLKAILSYSDPLPRAGIDGKVVTPGHIGIIYQSSNATYLGRAKPKTLLLAPSGQILSQRGLSKIRLQEQGHEGATRALLALGAPSRRVGESPHDWVTRALLEGPFRRIQHPGNHVYVFPLQEGLALPVAPHPYPKKEN